MAISAIRQYNNIMEDICREFLAIGEQHNETAGWNLRDMVSEMQYTLDQYEDPDCIYWQDAHDECQPYDKPWLKEWQKEKARMKRFIAKYKAEALKMECTQSHCSKYD